MNNAAYSTVRRFILAGLLCLLYAGCASTDDVGRLRWEMNNLKNDMKSVQKKSQSIETQLPGQAKEIDVKIRELESRQEATARTLSDLLIEVQDLTREFQKLTGQFEESRYFSEKSSAELIESKDALIAKISELELAVGSLNKKVSDTDTRIAALKEERQKSAAAKKKKPETKKKQKAPDTRNSGSKAAKDSYLSAYRSFKDGKMEKAREEFITLLEKYPENEYSDNARFWLAESYYKDGNFEDAILAYEELFKKNPKSDKVPGAMLKQGLAFYSLKDKKTGQIVLEKLVEKYPKTEAAKLALKKMKKTVPPPKKK